MTIVVAGSPGAGVSGLVAVLRERMQGGVVLELDDVELDDLESGERPGAVVFVVSSIAPMTASDGDLIDRACGYADLVVGAASKIDAHRQWRDVMTRNRALLVERSDRYRDVPWIGVSAAPDVGESNVDELVEVLAAGLADPGLPRRNRLRVNAVRAQNLRAHRADVIRRRRSATVTVRAGVQEARVRLIFLVRTRCARLTADLRLGAGEVRRGGSAAFEERVRTAAEEFVGEIDAQIARELGSIAVLSALTRTRVVEPPSAPVISDPRLRTDRLQFRLSAVLGAGFGTGVALASSRLLAEVLPGSAAACFVAGGTFGVLAAIWVVAARGLLHRRAALDRWVGEVATALRARGEEMVTNRLLAAEVAMMAEVMNVGDSESVL